MVEAVAEVVALQNPSLTLILVVPQQEKEEEKVPQVLTVEDQPRLDQVSDPTLLEGDMAAVPRLHIHPEFDHR